MTWNLCRPVLRWFLAMALSLLVVGCGGGGAPAAEPTATESAPQLPPTTAAPTEAATATPTQEPSATPTEAPTAAPTNTPEPREEVYFTWSPDGVPPSDSDDVLGIVQEITRHEGILDGQGNEIGLTVGYNPTLITIEEIQDILRSIGHPVDLADQ